MKRFAVRVLFDRGARSLNALLLQTTVRMANERQLIGRTLKLGGCPIAYERLKPGALLLVYRVVSCRCSPS